MYIGFQESIIPVDEEWFFVRHTDIQPMRPTLFFIHGLGGSGLCFIEAFEHPRLRHYNLVVPDVIGYGKSSRAHNDDYTFRTQLKRLRHLVSILGLRNISLIGHSMGGIIATLWCKSDANNTIRQLVNIEGNLTESDATFSRMADTAFSSCNYDFEKWLQWFRTDFMKDTVLMELGSKWSSCKRYYASLWFCYPEAFLSNAFEIIQMGKAAAPHGVNEIGISYKSISAPRLYYWGKESLKEDSYTFLQSEGLPNRGFDGAFHWPMIDKSDEFYTDLSKVIDAEYR